MERMDAILAKLGANENIDSETIFSILETLLLSYEKIDPQTLAVILEKIDLNNQISPDTIQNILDNLEPDQHVDSTVLADTLNGFIYNYEMFHGVELDIESIAVGLFDEFEQSPMVRELDPEEVPSWPKIIAMHYSNGEIDESDLDDVSVDCSLQAYKDNLDFGSRENLLKIWISSLPLCAMAQMEP